VQKIVDDISLIVDPIDKKVTQENAPTSLRSRHFPEKPANSILPIFLYTSPFATIIVKPENKYWVS